MTHLTPAPTDATTSQVSAGPASGEQWVLRRAGDVLTVVEVGGGLRDWSRDGIKVLAGYGSDELCLAGRGQLLIPWPNRIRDGRYQLDGTAYQLPQSEPKLGNASHGLVRWAPWRLADRTDDSLTVRHHLFPQPGWLWQLESSVTYRLADDGLSVHTEVTNIGAGRAPFGCGAHPYLNIGDTPLGGLTLRVPAGRYVTVDERMLPTGTAEVGGTTYDFRAARPIGDAALDTAFTDLTRDADGRWRVAIGGLPQLPTVWFWGDEAFGWTQVFTGKAAAEGEHGIAVEPMTCPADAFNSGTDLVRLGPGQTWSGTWGIALA
ncbi:MAG: aldose 1-epimerase family protein [Nostocoides sp.]